MSTVGGSELRLSPVVTRSSLHSLLAQAIKLEFPRQGFVPMSGSPVRYSAQAEVGLGAQDNRASVARNHLASGRSPTSRDRPNPVTLRFHCFTIQFKKPSEQQAFGLVIKRPWACRPHQQSGIHLLWIDHWKQPWELPPGCRNWALPFYQGLGSQTQEAQLSKTREGARPPSRALSVWKLPHPCQARDLQKGASSTGGEFGPMRANPRA